MNTRLRSQVTDRFTVQAHDGRRFEVTQTTTFISVLPLSGGWTPEQVQQIALASNGIPVNLGPDGRYEVLTTPPQLCHRLPGPAAP